MLTHLVLTILSDDKPGIVNDIAEKIRANHGNWLESRLTQLAGKFAGVISVSVDTQHISHLEAALETLSSAKIYVTVDKANDSNEDAQTSRSASFSVLGPDRAGIVKEIALAFSERGINVVELDTNCSSMPYSGNPLFEAKGKLALPSETDIHSLSDQLDVIADNLAVDISLTEED